MDIEVGEYVRIKYMYDNATIAKITEKRGKDPCYKNKKMYRTDRSVQHDGGSYESNLIYDEDIIKHSKNIIDLIESGDYVNGYEVNEINNLGIVVGKVDNILFEIVHDTSEIKSIVTKEEFENMKYEVEE